MAVLKYPHKLIAHRMSVLTTSLEDKGRVAAPPSLVDEGEVDVVIRHPYFDALRTFFVRLHQLAPQANESEIRALYRNLVAMQHDSAYWAPETFQIKLMPFVHILTAFLNREFEGNQDVENAWGSFLLEWQEARSLHSE